MRRPGSGTLIPSLLNYLRLTTPALSRIEFVLATSTVVAGLSFWTWADFVDVHHNARTKVSTAALAMDELVRRSLQAIDVVLETVVARAAEQGLDRLGSEPEREHLRRMTSRLPETGAIFIADKTGGRGVSLANLIRAELEPYAAGTNTSFDGPTIYLSPSATHAIAMVIHELTTNAAKYGALSRPNGRVSVRWVLATKERTGEMLTIEWAETGGPEVLPARPGYGSSVIRDLLAYELGGRADLVFAADGVRCTIDLPAQAAVEASEHNPNPR